MENNQDKYVVGVDIGGTTTKIGIVDRDGNIIAQTVITSRYGADEAEKYMDAIVDTVHELAKDKISVDQIVGYGVGGPCANYYSGTIDNPINLPWAQGRSVPIKEYIQNKTGVPLTITNDANAAAVGEMMYGAARGMKNFIMITLGTGVGSGIIINGQLVHGHDGFAGELGHTIIERHNGRPCGCGRSGCLDTYASATGVARTAREWMATGKYPDSKLHTLENLSSRTIYEAAMEGDELAKEIFHYTGTLLGTAFADFVAFSAPEAIVLFGGLARAGEILFKPIREAFEKNVLFFWNNNKVKIIHSSLKESDAAILGASALGW